MPVPQNMDDAFTGKIIGGGSKYFYIDNSEQTSDEQRAAAEDFPNWLVYDEDGQDFVSDKCALISPFRNNTVTCSNDIGAVAKEYIDNGNMIPNYDYDPDDHYSIVGASMQKYLMDEIDREGLAEEVEDYWSSVTPVEK